MDLGSQPPSICHLPLLQADLSAHSVRNRTLWATLHILSIFSYTEEQIMYYYMMQSNTTTPQTPASTRITACEVVFLCKPVKLQEIWTECSLQRKWRCRAWGCQSEVDIPYITYHYFIICQKMCQNMFLKFAHVCWGHSDLELPRTIQSLHLWARVHFVPILKKPHPSPWDVVSTRIRRTDTQDKQSENIMPSAPAVTSVEV